MIWLITFLISIPASVLANNIDAILESIAKKIVILNARRVSDTAESARLRQVWNTSLEAVPGSILKFARACLIVVRAPVPLPVVARRSLIEVVASLLNRPRLLLMMVIASSAALSEGAILGLAEPVARSGNLVPAWPGDFRLALGLGGAVAFVQQMRHPKGKGSLSHRAAASLLLLTCVACGFAMNLNAWTCLLAASIGGAAAMVSVVSTLRVTVRVSHVGKRVHMVIVWLFAFGISQAVAAVACGWLTNIVGPAETAVLLAAPAFFIATSELFLTARTKEELKRAMRRATSKGTNEAAQVISGV